MTTDAKIGLLLALIFIVAITFVINGIPDFLSKNNKAPDTAGYVNHYKGQQPALVGPSRNIAPALSHKVITVITETPKIDQNNPAETRYQALMPAAQEAVKTDAAGTETVQKELVEIKPAEKPATEQQQSAVVYIVCPGDSLAEIAKKFYGPENGKKLASVEKIYNANKDKLESIDQIQVGQKLTIPSLENQTKALLKTGFFEKVPQNTPPQTAPPPKEQFRQYVVKESDSLWRIATEQLGNGNRFNEIIQLNQSVITDPDTLVIGMKLKLPAR